MSTCDSNCSTCGKDCPSRKQEGEQKANPFLAEANPGSKVKRMIGVISGKGGVGKSLVTSLLAVAAARAGKKAGILDADVTGPSIPHMFGIERNATGDGNTLYPVVSDRDGVRIMSVNVILENKEDPVVWRGPVINGVVKQFWTDVAWGELDELFVDMPPGTGDVPLTVYQSLPLDGIIVVTSPQDLVSMVVEKAVRMAEKMNIPILGFVENMSYYVCPHCGEKLYPYGEGKVLDFASEHGVVNVAELPIDSETAKLCDSGRIEEIGEEFIRPVAELL